MIYELPLIYQYEVDWIKTRKMKKYFTGTSVFSTLSKFGGSILIVVDFQGETVTVSFETLFMDRSDKL